MTLLKPHISLNRLAIFKKGKSIYDEHFRKGVNIIRGSNSSGKSTITDFIFFALGGDFIKWKPEAENCDHVMAELEINGAVISLKRSITYSPRQALYIYWGPFDEANKSAIEGWQVYPFQRGPNKESFSQVLFRALEFPEVRGDDSSNITMHQILRLIYIDQLSPVDSLMMEETWDTGLVRSTVGDLLLGIYDDALYADKLMLRDKQKESERVKQQFRSVLDILGEAEQEVDLDTIQKSMKDTEAQLEKIQEALERVDQLDEVMKKSHSLEEYKNLRNEFLSLKEKLASMQDDAINQELEVEDSRLFIESLEKRTIALDDSIKTRAVLGQIPLTHCPVCLSPLQEPPSRNFCLLCKQEIPKDTRKSQALRMRQELEYQIRESKTLLVEKEKRLVEIMRNLPQIAENTKAVQRRFQELVSHVKTKRDEHIDSLLIKKGSLESQLDYLHRQAKAAGILESLKSQKATLAQEVARLELSIQSKRKKQEARKAEAMSRIEYYTLELLKKDLRREEAFRLAESVSIDFSKNSFAVDGRNQFSASSVTYLKNSIHYGIFFSSLELNFFRYPRLIICDNMEDKGMEPRRSQNFQRVILELSKTFGIEHQIIFTTSMIDPNLNTSELCIGEEYSEDNKALRV